MTLDDMSTVLEAPPHPGMTDPAYRARRDAIAAIARRQRVGEPAPRIDYRPDEHEVWRAVDAALAPLHDSLACSEYRRAKAALGLDGETAPQLCELSARLQALTGFTVEAVEGLVPGHQFFDMLARRCFPSTQFLRHPAFPLYTPEPDMAHELIGHVVSLASPVFADLYELAGRAGQRARTGADLTRLGKFFWFTMEFGVCVEDGELVAYGAGLLSSFGELGQFRTARVEPFDPAAMETADYDIEHYQPLLYRAGDFDETVRAISDHFDGFCRGPA